MKIVGRLFLSAIAFVILAAPATAATLERKMTTKYVDTDAPCDVPVETRTFLSADGRIWLWFRVNGAAPGDRPRAEWVAPNGGVYATSNWNPVTGSGFWCFWAYLDISETAAASQLGGWTVRVSYNSNAFFSQSFTLVSLSQMTTRAIDSNAPCNRPVEAQFFSTTDPRVWLWYTVNGAAAGAVLKAEWSAPDDSTYRSVSWNPLASSGNWCFRDSIAIAGDTAAQRPGQWSIRVSYNGDFLFYLGFNITTVRYNSALAFQVGADGRFNAGAAPDPQTGLAGANSYGIIYRWPGYPSTSFTTLRIDSADWVFGTDGVKVEAPVNIDASTNRSRWRVGDIEVTQLLQLASNNQTGREDVIKISYIVRNIGAVQHSVGGRVMIDTDINLNDGVPFRVPDVGIISREREFTGTGVPDSFQAFFDVTDTRRVTLSTLRGGGATAPDRLVLASWRELQDTLYDYAIDPNRDFTDDSAYAVYWNPRPLAPGESRTYTTFYGLSAVQVDASGPLALGLSGPAALSVVNNRYSPDPFDITATVQNTGSTQVNNVQLTLNLPPGLGLDRGNATALVGIVPAGQERQISWRVATGPRTGPGTYTYSVTATAANTPSKIVSRTITLPTISVTHSLSGTVGIWDGREFWKLNGSRIDASVTATSANNNSIVRTVPVSDGAYSLSDLQSGGYNVVLTLRYRDDVTVNNRIDDHGCEDNSLTKSITIKRNSIEVFGKAELNFDFPPPLVMVHGYRACYGKWYQKDKEPGENREDPKKSHWDNFVRDRGIISFTPNYKWYEKRKQAPKNASWADPVREIKEQIENGFKGLTRDITARGHYPAWAYIAHSTGGLVGRVLVYQEENSELVKALRKLYLLGTPNSGGYGKAILEGAGSSARLFTPSSDGESFPIHYHLSEDNVQTGFNKQYRDFKDKEVFVFAGNADKVQGSEADGVVRVDSVYNIQTKASRFLSLPDLESIKLKGKTFSYFHEQLGSTDSLELILGKEILVDLATIFPPRTSAPTLLNEATGTTDLDAIVIAKAAEPAQASAAPSSARLYKTLIVGQTLAAGQIASHGFTVGATDAIVVDPATLEGAATFALIDPAGRAMPFASAPSGAGEKTSDEFGESLILRNPAPGQWQLRATAGAAGVTYIFLALENSPAGFEAGLQESQVAAGQPVNLVGRAYGGLQQANVTASIVNATSDTMATVILFDDGRHQDGAANDGVFGATAGPLTSSGRYYAIFTARGVFNGRAVVRQSDVAIDVLGPARLLSGSFNDTGYDADGDGQPDAVRVTTGFTAPAAGSYLISGDLLDAQGFLLGHAVDNVEANAPGGYSARLDFYLKGKVCGQFGGGFSLKNVTLSSGTDFRTLDVWGDVVVTRSYDGALFNCSSASLAPRPLNVQPEAMLAGDSGQVLISGSGFASGARLSFGAGVNVGAITRISSNLLVAQISVAADAQPGARDLTITNPEGVAATGAGLFRVASDGPPTVSIAYPADRQTVRGTLTASAAASDDRGVQRVEFYLDGRLAMTDYEFPYQFLWETGLIVNGSHLLGVKAYDLSGQTRESQITVTVSNTVVASVSAASFTGVALAAESIVAAFGTSLATSVQIASSLPLPTSLAGTTAKVKDSAGGERLAPLFFVAPAQVNYQIPPGMASGSATVTVTSGDGAVSTGTVQIASVAPGLFSVNASGQGLAAAVALRVRADGSLSYEPITRFDSSQNKFVAVPIDLGPPSDQVFLILYGTGWRSRSSLTAATVKIGGADTEILYAGLADGFVGLDQLNARLPRSLAGRGEVDIVLTVDGKPANIVRVSFR